MELNTEKAAIFLLSISILLLFAKLFGELFNKIKQPAIIGEIFAGVILGPTIFGNIFPTLFEWIFPQNGFNNIALDGLTTLAVVLLLLVSGLEVDLNVILRQGKATILTGIMGIIIPFAMGFILSYLFPVLMGIQDIKMKFIFALFMGTALSISALPVIAKTLMDLKIFKTDVGYIIISAAMLNDIVGWLIFSIILGMIGMNEHSLSFGYTILLIFIFTFLVLIIGRKLINKVLPVIQNKFTFPGSVLNFILIIGFLAAAFTEYIGVHAIFGAFIMGIAIGDSAHLNQKTRELIQQFVTNIFAPIFFISIGLKVNFINNFDLVIVLMVLVLAFAGKVIGCGLGARWGGLSINKSLAVGFGMNSRGAMEIILGMLALQAGLISENVFVALVIMALLTSMASAPFIKYFLKKENRIK